MSDKDHNLVTSKASSVIAQNLKVTLATPAGAITPATLTAMAGLAKGGALQVAPSVTNAISLMGTKAAELANTNPTLSAALTSAQNNLSTLSAKLLPSGNPAAFGQMAMQAQGHINDAIELKAATTFMSQTSFGDLGSGISNVSSSVTQGMDKMMGSLPAAGAALEKMGSMFDMTNMKNFGTSAGLIDKLNSVKLGNASGINEALRKAGVDTDRLTDPVYASSVDKAMSSITDPKVLNTVASQLKVNPFAGLPSYSGADASVNTGAGSILGG